MCICVRAPVLIVGINIPHISFSTDVREGGGGGTALLERAFVRGGGRPGISSFLCFRGTPLFGIRSRVILRGESSVGTGRVGVVVIIGSVAGGGAMSGAIPGAMSVRVPSGGGTIVTGTFVVSALDILGVVEPVIGERLNAGERVIAFLPVVV